MAVTTEHYYTGNASTTSFAYTFPYYKTADIKVTWDGVLKTEGTHYDVTGTNVVFKTSPTDYTPANNVVVRIYRDTDVDTSKATFAAGNSIRATDLNNNQIQLLYSAQERQSSGTVNSNISNKAEIEVSKLKDGSARQLLQTAANGDDVEWTSNVDVPGTLDVTGVVDFDSNLTVDGTSTLTGNVTVGGTVDGRDVAADGAKLDGIEAGATADQTAAEIRVLVEAANDSNVFTDADHAKLNNIEAGAAVNQNAFANIAVSGQTTVAADAVSDTLTFAAGSNVTLTTNASNDTVTIASTDTNTGDTNQNAFSNISVSGQTTVAADTTTDTLELAAGSNITLTTDASNDKVTIAASGGEVTVKDEGSALSTAATALNFVGAGVTATGTGAEKTITIPGGSGSALTIKEEGTALSTAATSINFVGSNVTASGTGADKTVTITGGGDITVQDEGSALSTAATTLNFVGAGVTASGTGATKTITISGSGGSPITTDYQYLELKAHNNTSGAFSAGSADYELVTKGTTTAVSPDQAAAMLISIGGVLQEPNTGTSIGSNDGFCIDGSSIHFGANLTAHPEYIIWMKGSGSHVVADNSVTGAKIALGSDAAGDIMYYNGTDYVRLPKGTNGHYLKQGTSNAPEWAAVSATVGGSTGLDLDDNVKLRFGTDNDVECYYSGDDFILDLTETGKNILISEDVRLSSDLDINGSHYVSFYNGSVASNNLKLSLGYQIGGNGSLIQNKDSAGLKIWSDWGKITKETNTAFKYIEWNEGTSVDLYYANSKKLETTNTGVTVTGGIIAGGLTYPTSDGSNGQVLTTNGSGALSFSTVSGGGGGGTGTDYNDSVKTRWGTGDDLEIYHDGSNSYIKDVNGSTDLIIDTAQNFYLKHSGETMIQGTNDGSVDLYYDNSKKFETQSYGVKVSGNCNVEGHTKPFLNNTYDLGDDASRWRDIYVGNDIDISDNGKILLGTGDDLQIYHDGSNSYIKDSGTGNLYNLSNDWRVNNAANTENMMIAQEDDAVELYFDGAKKFETASGGVQATGQLYFAAAVDPNISIRDSGSIAFGNGDDLKIWHDGNSNIIKAVNSHTTYIDTQGAWLYLQSNAGIVLGDVSANETFLKATDNGAVELYYDGTKKFETTSDGATVTGKLRVDISTTGTAGGGAAEGIFLRNTNETDNNAVTIFGGADDYANAASAINFINVDHSANYGDISFDTRSSGGYAEKMRITTDGIAVGRSDTSVSSSAFGCSMTTGGSLFNSRNVDGNSGVMSNYGNAGEHRVLGDGDVYNTNNTYGQISDQTLKQDIVDAASQWDDIKQVKVRKFRFKDKPTAPLQIGVVAQELETISPGLVKEQFQNGSDGNKVKAVKYSVLYMKAIKALQEAMAKIETLETKVAALEAG